MLFLENLEANSTLKIRVWNLFFRRSRALLWRIFQWCRFKISYIETQCRGWQRSCWPWHRVLSLIVLNMLVIKWMTKSSCGRIVTLVWVHPRECGGALILVSNIDICSVWIVWALQALILVAGQDSCFLVIQIVITVLEIVWGVCGGHHWSRLGDRRPCSRGKEISGVWRVFWIFWGSDSKVSSKSFVS